MIIEEQFRIERRHSTSTNTWWDSLLGRWDDLESVTAELKRLREKYPEFTLRAVHITKKVLA